MALLQYRPRGHFLDGVVKPILATQSVIAAIRASRHAMATASKPSACNGLAPERSWQRPLRKRGNNLRWLRRKLVASS